MPSLRVTIPIWRRTPRCLACPGWSPSCGSGRDGCIPSEFCSNHQDRPGPDTVEMVWSVEVRSLHLRMGSSHLTPAFACFHSLSANRSTLFGLSRCRLYLCPSQSTVDMLASHSLPDARIWSRGVDLRHFNSANRSRQKRAEWGVFDKPEDDHEEGIKGSSSGWRDAAAGAQPPDISETKTTTTRSNSSYSLASPPLCLDSGLVTPPRSPELLPVTSSSLLRSSIRSLANSSTSTSSLSSTPSPTSSRPSTPSRATILYVGRISWEKNLLLLLHALHFHLPNILPPSSATARPKLVFVGDGPASTLR